MALKEKKEIIVLFESSNTSKQGQARHANT